MRSKKIELVLDKYLLFTPGPVNVAASLRNAICKEDICHREPDFDGLLASIEQKLLSLFEIKKRDRYRAVVITGSGTAANEAILSSVVGTGAILILSNGEFGERLHKTSLIHNKHTYLLQQPWGMPFDPDQIATYLAAHKIDAIAMVHHETCSGMLNPLAAIGAMAKAHGAIFVVDGVSSVGAEVVDMEGCNIAFCSSSSSKAIGSYPGLSFVIGRKKQFKKLKLHAAKTTYLNLATFYGFLKRHSQTPNTPAVPLFFAFDQALTNILSEGVANRFARIRARAGQLRLGMRKLNLEFVLDEEDMCAILTTVRVPPSIYIRELRDKLREKSIIIYEGKGCFAGKVFQVGNIGELSDHDIQFFLSTLRSVLLELQAKAVDGIAPIRPMTAKPTIQALPKPKLAKILS
ncbi:alanine--glyoxylate aminotransferase family protein [Puniceibacterium sp. IMCC21224]|uniref:pyridoxal-phosphate-dependent aminotransferase family protein n=1 Tax=Puniceibacterium sp. IMCC21224 TaxID=1618204 RepID=UPI00064E04AB|nr:aminotransferase class V-fold PLP-dependent enzyme [Puniceibacterium sp. IMCC21224]KMK63775.1 serine-pyruvate aminotransferase/archaeal aspartate aminotransferase [Puniceibacterium sp. IMCC21224]KMK63809.1 serine-pyruvate aminotransferase/archaeal aspartate aminotransferase [Puniceibacterium sp. IMCC21224]